jgi:hypothetical protein
MFSSTAEGGGVTGNGPVSRLAYYVPLHVMRWRATRSCGHDAVRGIDDDPFQKTAQERYMSTQKTARAAMAAAAALLFTSVAAPTASAADQAKVKCEGVNACKGHSACATATNACSGQNTCKGKGYLLMGKAECDAAKAKMQKPS